MSDPTTNAEPTQQGQSPKELREFAERQQADAEAARTEAETLRTQNRTLTFQAAGVDLESPVGKLFDKAYEGDLTVDAVKAGWAEVAPPSAAATPAEPVDDGPTPDELANQAARTAVATGASPPGAEPTADPWPDALAGYQADRAKGVRVEAAENNALAKIFTAAASGDERVLG